MGLALLAGVLTSSTLQAADTEKRASAAKPYAQRTCPVSGEKLGAMGKPYLYTYKDRQVQFCCRGCVKDFNKDPEKYVKALEAGERTAKSPGADAHSGHTH
jgi:YHS domain-containing protein